MAIILYNPLIDDNNTPMGLRIQQRYMGQVVSRHRISYTQPTTRIFLKIVEVSIEKSASRLDFGCVEVLTRPTNTKYNIKRELQQYFGLYDIFWWD